MMPAVGWPDGLVAFWDFQQPTPPYTTRAGRGEFPLRAGAGARVTSVSGGPFGRAARFDGQHDYLRIPWPDTGLLNMAAAGECSVLARVKRANAATHFLAGIWQEDDAAPGRQYGLFVSLPAYGGDNQVCGHVSRSGGPTPGYPYSRDYSASARTVPVGEWSLVGFTYDGRQAVSYLDGVADPRPSYTDVTGAEYAKNPYDFFDGLNPEPRADFTVGAVLLSRGMGNFYAGDLGGLAVFDRALSADEVRRLRLAGDSRVIPCTG